MKNFESPSRSSGASRLVVLGWAVVGIAALFYTYEYLLRIEPSVMVPGLLKKYQITAEGLGFLVALYYYAYTPLQAAVGIITDKFGIRRVLIFAVCSCVFGALLFDLSPTIYLAGVGRLLVGVGSAFAFVGALKLAAIWLPKKRFALFAGMTTAMGMVGAATGDVVLSWLVVGYGWERVMLWSAIAGFLLIPLFIIFIREHPTHVMQEKKLSFREVMQGFGKLIRRPRIIYAGLIGCMLYASLSVVGELWGISFIQAATGLSSVRATEVNSFIFLGWLVGGPFAGWLSDRLQSRRILLIFGGIFGAITFSIILIWPNSNAHLLELLFFLFGLFCSAEILCFAIPRDIVSIELTATAIGIINLLVMLGGAILQPLVGYLLNLNWQGQLLHGVRIYDAMAYRKALIVVPVAILISVILAAIMKESYQKDEWE